MYTLLFIALALISCLPNNQGTCMFPLQLPLCLCGLLWLATKRFAAPQNANTSIHINYLRFNLFSWPKQLCDMWLNPEVAQFGLFISPALAWCKIRIWIWAAISDRRGAKGGRQQPLDGKSANQEAVWAGWTDRLWSYHSIGTFNNQKEPALTSLLIASVRRAGSVCLRSRWCRRYWGQLGSYLLKWKLDAWCSCATPSRRYRHVFGYVGAFIWPTHFWSNGNRWTP